MKINRSDGINKSERYLKKLCDKTFLSLWSYPNPYRKKGKELCDLLVVFGNKILIFSIKNCDYPTTDNTELNWSRWFDRAIKKSAKQLWGAERWIKNHPNRVFLDAQCNNKFPFKINPNKANIHLILVSLGVSEACKKYFEGGRGSLMISNEIKGFDQHEQPFIIGDLNPDKTFIHILDDITLDIIMESLDTVSDFTSYIQKKENIFRSNRGIHAFGEEGLLPYYLKGMKNGEHDFNFPEGTDFVIAEGEWKEFCNHPQRKAQLKEDEISYLWDSIIEGFNDHALNGTQYKTPSGGIKDSEKILRFLASESRYRRRLLSKALYGLVMTTGKNMCTKRVSVPKDEKSPFYVFVCYPRSSDISDEEYRELRSLYLNSCVRVLKVIFPNAEDVIGYAVKSGAYLEKEISEDLVYFDATDWSEEDEKHAKKIQEELGIFTDTETKEINEQEFPEV